MIIPKTFWQTLAKFDKDTFIFGSVFAIVILALAWVKAEAIYFVLTGAGFIILYIFMRIALLKVQLLEREHKMKRSPARRARQIVDQNATKSEKQNLDNLSQSVKTKRK